jgi:hypothetical protein
MKLKIDNNHYTITSEPSVQLYQDVMQLDFDHLKSWPIIIQRYTKCTEEESLMLPMPQRQLAMSLIISQINRREPTDIKPLSELTFGQFIDLDVYINLSVDKHLDKISDLLGTQTIAAKALWQVDQFIAYRTYILRQYKVLFGLDEEDFEIDEDDQAEWDPMSLARNWYKVIVALAGDDILNIDSVTDQPLIKVLNFMALQKEKAEALAQQQKRQQYDLQRNRR